MNVKILVIDDNKPLRDQFERLAESSGYGIYVIHQAYVRAKGYLPTETSFFNELVIDVIAKETHKEVYLEKKLSYVAQQKQLPKFRKNK